jgi:3-oxoacyl-[acyl-carrier protein] reductase
VTRALLEKRSTPRPAANHKEATMPEQPANTVIVTGASRGIGRAIALRLAGQGYGVIVGYAAKADQAEAVVRSIAANGGQALAVRVDVAEAAQVAALFATAKERLGPVFAVVNSAGIMPLAPIAEADPATFDWVMAINLRGTFLVLAQAAREVARGGRIVTLSSSVIAKSFPGYGPYIASKAGVEGLTRVLANELRGREITVNAVAPGPVGTELFLAGKSPEQIEQLGKLAPLERLGRPEDIAGVVAFLLGPDGGWINGQVLRANGGFA